MSLAPPPPLPAIRRLSQREAAEDPRLPTRVTGVGAFPIPDRVLGAYELPRGSMFVGDLDQPEPVACDLGYSGRAYVVVAREWGDLSWPVHVRGHRTAVDVDHRRLAALHLGDWWEKLLPELAWSRRTFTRVGVA